MYDINQLSSMLQCSGTNNSSIEQKEEKQKIIYARVSSANTAKQSEDLERQVQELKQAYPQHYVIKDVGSGLNFHRPGFKTLLERVYKGTIQEVVVMHKDRLCRFGIELVDFIFAKAGVKLLVHSKSQSTEEETGEQQHTKELADDLMSIVTVFVASHNGRRSAENKRRRIKQQKEAEQLESSRETSTQPSKRQRIQQESDEDGDSDLDSEL